MKKTLFILCALLLTAVGASAQTPYEFHAEDWIQNPDRTTESSLVYNEDNTITVTATNYASAYTNNISLGNSWTYSNTAAGITTNGYTITSEQSYFVIVGSDLSTDTTADTGDSFLWWLNGWNQASQVVPDQVVTLESGNASGQTLFAWDISEKLTGVTANSDGTIPLSGWTCFGLTSTDETSHKSTISYIGFCKPSEATSSFTVPTNTYVHACTANVNVWTTTLTNGGTLGDFKVDEAVKNDESGMEPPFLTYYVWEGESGSATNYLPDTKITHETIEGLTAGVYEVSLDIRIIDYDTDANVSEGTTFNANSVSQDIKLGVDANEISFYDDGDRDDIYGTYTLYVEVGEEGTLSVSLDIKDATYNWIMFKNLTVRLLGEDETIPSGTVSGTMGADYGTLILPFDATITDGLTAYTAGEVTNDADGESVLTLTAVDGNLTAGTPYIIGGTSGSETYTFSGVPTKYEVSYTDGLLTGTLVNLSLANGDFTTTGNQYVLQNHEDEGGLAFYPITSESTGVTLDAYHCYLTYSNPSGVKGFISFPNTDDETTAIEAVEGAEAEANGAIYDLSGRKVSKAVKGVYIQNGKKVLVK